MISYLGSHNLSVCCCSVECAWHERQIIVTRRWITRRAAGIKSEAALCHWADGDSTQSACASHWGLYAEAPGYICKIIIVTVHIMEELGGDLSPWKRYKLLQKPPLRHQKMLTELSLRFLDEEKKKEWHLCQCCVCLILLWQFCVCCCCCHQYLTVPYSSTRYM